VNYFQSARINPGAVTSAAAVGTGPNIVDVARFVGDGLITPMAYGFSQAVVNFFETVGGLGARAVGGDRARARKSECCCEPEDPCHCTCCIVDADVVVYIYLGERRVLPLTLGNHRRRKKEVNVALDAFKTRAGKPAPIKGTLLPPAQFELGPCAVHPIVIVVDTAPAGGGGAVPEQFPDVDDCTVYYADLRLDGCDIRPVRIAVAILPRDCGAYTIDCHSCCCC
jgi:hypothetical protein